MKSQPFQSANSADESGEKNASLLFWAGVALLAVVAFLFMFFTYNSGKKPLPSEYSAQDLHNGQSVLLSEYRGFAIVLMSWATWCMDCEEELTALENLWISERERGLVVIAVNLDSLNANERIEEMVNGYDLTYPVWRDPENVFFSTFNAPGIPTTVLLNKQGTVLRAWVGPVDFESADVKSEIEAALGQ
jgi:peroxiredoxin